MLKLLESLNWQIFILIFFNKYFCDKTMKNEINSMNLIIISIYPKTINRLRLQTHRTNPSKHYPKTLKLRPVKNELFFAETT